MLQRNKKMERITQIIEQILSERYQKEVKVKLKEKEKQYETSWFKESNG